MKIYKFTDFNNNNEIANTFINNLGLLTESNKIDYIQMQDKIIKDLKLNILLVGQFGTGISALYPFVDELMKNTKANITPEQVVLLTICAITTLYIEDKKYKDNKEASVLTNDAKSMLEELKLNGIGNATVRKTINSFRTILNMYIVVTKKTLSSLIDLFSYTALAIPIINSINILINQNGLSLDSFITNMKGIMIGVSTIIAKNGIELIANKIGMNKKDILKNIDVVDIIDDRCDGGDEIITENKY